jgi:hypothetical protein
MIVLSENRVEQKCPASEIRRIDGQACGFVGAPAVREGRPVGAPLSLGEWPRCAFGQGSSDLFGAPQRLLGERGT